MNTLFGEAAAHDVTQSAEDLLKQRAAHHTYFYDHLMRFWRERADAILASGAPERLENLQRNMCHMNLQTETTEDLERRMNAARNYAALIADLPDPTPLQQRAATAYQDIAADIDAELLRRKTAEFAAQGKVVQRQPES